MDPNHKMFLALFAVLAALGVVYYFQKRGVSLVPQSSQTVTLSSVAGSNITGTATLTQLDKQTKITLKLSGGTFTSHPAHVHLGSCPTPGAVKYPLVDIGPDGTSVTTLGLTLAQLKSLSPLAINVHKSPDELGVSLSCGNL